MSENEDFFLVPFIPPPAPTELEPLAAVPVDKSSVTGFDVALDGDDDNVGEFSGFFPRRNLLNAPSHFFRGGVPHGVDVAVAIINAFELEPDFIDKQDVDSPMN